MNFLSKNISLFVYKNPINMHKSFNGLITLAITELALDFTNDTYVLFVNRDRNQFKILFMRDDQPCIFTMRLSGSMKADFAKINEINTSLLRKLIKTRLIRRHRFGGVLEA